MGFIPIIVTLAGACLLFIIVVGNHLVTRKNHITRIQENILKGLNELGVMIPSNSSSFSNMDQFHAEVLEVLNNERILQNDSFRKSITDQLQSIQMVRLQYNQLIAQKPYSFVAKIKGIQAI
jgi:hypothetical protein